MHRIKPENTIIFLCDVQEKFILKTYGKEGVIQATKMLLEAALVMGIPVIVTEHNKKIFGETCVVLK